MPRYRILRNVPGAMQEDIDAAAMRAIWCLAEFPGLRWLRSYWDRETEALLCIYEAPNADLIWEHAQSSRIPCDEVREVLELNPGDYLHPDDVLENGSGVLGALADHTFVRGPSPYDDDAL